MQIEHQILLKVLFFLTVYPGSLGLQNGYFLKNDILSN